MTFDFNKFSINAIKTIDEIRATNSNPTNTMGSVERVESRINAFYRALGLPAFGTIGNYNNGNLFDISNISNEYRYKMFERKFDFTKNIPEEKIKSFLDYNNFNITDGLEIDETKAKRIRGSLIPMLVNGDISVYPKSNRVAGAFYDKDQILDDVQYRRPLIELITLLRLRGEGLYDTEINQAIREDFDLGLFAGEVDFNIMTSQIVSNLLQVILEIPDFINKTIKEINKIRTQIRKNFKAEIANIPSEQPIESDSNLDGSIEKMKSSQQEVRNSNSILVSLLEFDDSITGGTEITRNMKDALLASVVLNMVESKIDEVDKQISDTQDKEKKLLSKLKGLQQKVDLILGIYSGISGIDILLIITALFIVERKYLLGLFNSEAQDRLLELKGNSDLGTVESVVGSIRALEAKVKELFDLIVQQIE
jgi:hypothetical protein